MTDATHTRESVIEECATELERLILPSMPDYLKAHIQADVDYLRGLKSISTPIPLTPSDDLEYRLGAAYQVIGCFLDYLGVFDSENGQKLLDYFGGRDGASDPLPFSVACLPITPSDEMVGILKEIIERDDRNGSLPLWYREKIEAALNLMGGKK